MDPRLQQRNKIKEPKISIWERIANQSLKTLADRIKFLFTFTLIGLILIAGGDGLMHLTFNGIGIALTVVGYVFIAAGFISILFHYLESN